MQKLQRIIVCLILFGSLLPVGAQETSTSIAVTVYNEGTALIRDQRNLTLEEGINRINFRDVAATIDPTSVRMGLVERSHRHGSARAELHLRPGKQFGAAGAISR